MGTILGHKIVFCWKVFHKKSALLGRRLLTISGQGRRRFFHQKLKNRRQTLEKEHSPLFLLLQLPASTQSQSQK